MKLLRVATFIMVLIGVVFGMGIYSSRVSTISKTDPLVAASTNLVTETPNDSSVCLIDELKLNSENGSAVNGIIKDNCLLATVTKLSNGKTLIDGVGYGCVSCHAKTIYILKNNKVIFKYDGDDSTFKEISGGFQIREPIRKDDEPLCCAKEYIIKKFKYNEFDDGITKTD